MTFNIIVEIGLYREQRQLIIKYSSNQSKLESDYFFGSLMQELKIQIHFVLETD
jgi:hypothetical protein